MPSCSISLVLSQLNKQKPLLIKSYKAAVALRSENEANLLVMTGAAASRDVSAEVEQATEVLSEVMNSVCYIYSATFSRF